MWDRLGKPSTDVPEEGENVSLFDVGDKKQDEKAQNQCVSVASGLDGETARHNKGYRDLNKCHESEKLKNCVTGTFIKISISLVMPGSFTIKTRSY